MKAVLKRPAMRKVVLVADDDPDILSLLVDVLSDEGFEVEAAVGRDTIRELEAHQPDVVLLDYQMPEMDGVQIAREIRAHPDLRHVQIIAMTAAGQAARVCHQMGASGCLGKPFNIQDILDLIHHPDHRAHVA